VGVTAQEQNTLAGDPGLVDLHREALPAFVKQGDIRAKAVVAAKGFGSDGCAE
jgi:hypothetical protein